MKPADNGCYLMCKSPPHYLNFNVQMYIYPSVKCIRSFCVSAIHQTLTWTTGSSTCVCDHSYVCVYTWGLVTPTASQHNIFYSEKNPHLGSLVLLRGVELGSWNVESDALQIEPPRHLTITLIYFRR